MKKGIKLTLSLLAASILVTGCNGNENKESSQPTESSEREVYHLVSFYVDNTLYKTARVKEGFTIGTTTLISDPTKDGYTFEGWTTADSKTFDLANDAVTADLSLYAKFTQNVTPTPDPDPSPTNDLNVDDTKDSTKTYYLVVGWYAKTETSGLDDATTRHFYSNLNVYLKYKGATDAQLGLVSFRKFAQDKVADMGTAINEQGDIDILVGVGKNITSKGNVETKARTDGIEINGQSRSVARLTDNDVAQTVYNFLITDLGKRLYDSTYTLTNADIAAAETPTPDPDPSPTNDLNVDDTKDSTKNYYLVVGWYAYTSTSGLDDAITKHFYSNLNIYLTYKGASSAQLDLVSFRKFSQDKVADMGTAINEQGDIDILVGVGKNITSKGGVATEARKDEIMMGGQSRSVARLTNDEVATYTYNFIISATGQKMFDTTYTLTDVDITAAESSSSSSETI